MTERKRAGMYPWLKHFNQPTYKTQTVHVKCTGGRQPEPYGGGWGGDRDGRVRGRQTAFKWVYLGTSEGASGEAECTLEMREIKGRNGWRAN